MNNGEWPKLVSELDLVGLTHRNVYPLLTYVIYLSCQFTRSLLIHIAPRKKYPQTDTQLFLEGITAIERVGEGF